jgi:hypothetical protein
MKVYFGFNDIRQDGMGSEAMYLLKANAPINTEAHANAQT